MIPKPNSPFAALVATFFFKKKVWKNSSWQTKSLTTCAFHPPHSDISASGPVSVTSFIQNDVRQWAMVHHEDFEEEVKGWSNNAVSSCDGVDHHLGGHCNEIDGEVRILGELHQKKDHTHICLLRLFQIKKTFNGLGQHTYLRIQARYHFLDSWEGETAFAKIGGK
jgi:hypothetical protein